MRILQTMSYFNLKSGGPTTCTYSLLKGLNEAGVSSDILTFFPEEGDSFPGDDAFIKAVELPEMKRLSYSKPFLNFLRTHTDYQLYHVNGLWQYPSHCAAKYARRVNKPYVISPHGMLYPFALEYSKTIKKIFMQLWFRKDIEQAACIHVTCEEEMRHVRNLGFKNPIAIIPNPIDIEPLMLETDTCERNTIAFIGRLSPIKNVDRLIQAWHKLGEKTAGYELLIVGDGEQRSELESLGQQLKIENLTFTGFLTGENKKKIYKKMRTMVLPSQSENFGMVVAESLLNKVPVIASKGTPWKDLVEYDAGWWVDNSIEELSKAIQQAINISHVEVNRKGDNGRRLVQEKYSTDIVSDKMKQLYKYIIKEGDKPDFVYI